ncbi:Leucine aminopeptidase 1 [Cytospora paraplurivora]|uniref:Peptide hydrolase n=1 Tax=Cytospora paraplurivora TaxID=2898453 RepID=A0AAN9UI57_9PEZI
MKLSTSSVVALLAPAVTARFVEKNEGNNVLLYPDAFKGESVEKYLIELSPGSTRWVTEEEKWELRRNGQRFMDITDTQDLGAYRTTTSSDNVIFPVEARYQDKVHPLLEDLSKKNLRKNLEKFTSLSDYGRESSEWLLEQVQAIIDKSGAEGVHAEAFPHSWQQNSIIATIPGQTNSTIVIAAHQDSINLWLPSILPAPGADDDGSGTVTILEAFRALLSEEAVQNGTLQNTVEFHWYSAEEGGLLGSRAIFSEYEKQGRDVKAMLQQDMTGYVQGTLDAGKPESVGVITDFVDKKLTAFIKKIVVEYCTIPYVETKCGYACSDHASASKAGYPSAFVIESAFEDSDKHIHNTDDLIKYLSFDHMLQHARLTLAFAYELGSTDFATLKSEEAGEWEL